jgi:miniconductance mechanosensitive channel
MLESEGRRIRRSLLIDMTSVHFSSETFQKELFQHALVKRVLTESALLSLNQQNENGKPTTNLGIFRCYVEAYIRSLPVFHKEMPYIVHYLQSNEHGIPLEMTFFTKNKDYMDYEALQSELIEHLLSMLPVFELKVYQRPGGY